MAKRSFSFLQFYSSKDSIIPEIMLYKAEKCKTKRRKKNDKISEKVKAPGIIASTDFA